ncbi:MAG: orotate phosphoribosyltransferase [Rickettsiales bacterium]|nr:orotate phosphoribosyltransferase [Rickettsiales bacterium]
MNNDEIMSEFEAAQAILKGHFILSSGLHSDTYLQCARVLMDTNRAARLCKALADKVREQIDVEFDMVVAPAMGGVVVGYEMGRQMNVPSIFCERENSEFTLRRGFDIEDGANVLLVEDVVTTGKSSLEAAECIRGYGGDIIAEACLVDRSGGDHKLSFPLISLVELEVATYESNKLPNELAEIPPIKPGSRWLKA